MSSASGFQPILPRPAARRRIIPGTLALGLAALSVAWFWQDLVLRREAVALLSACGLTSRSATVETVRLLEAGDLAAAFAVEAALAEVAPGGNAAAASARYGPRTRQMLTSAAKLSACAVAARPASAHHRVLLGQAGYAAWDLDPRPTAAATGAWQQAFRVAMEGAPGFDLVAVCSADAALAAWPRLSAAGHEEAIPAIRRAFLSPRYVRRVFPDAWRLMGASAGALLPEQPEQVGEAAAALRAVGETTAATDLEQRRERLSGEPAR